MSLTSTSGVRCPRICKYEENSWDSLTKNRNSKQGLKSLLKLKIKLHLHKLQFGRGHEVHLLARNLYEVEIDAQQLKVHIDKLLFVKFNIGNFNSLQEVWLQSSFYEAKRQLGEVGELLDFPREVFSTINKATLYASSLVVGDSAFGVWFSSVLFFQFWMNCMYFYWLMCWFYLYRH